MKIKDTLWLGVKGISERKVRTGLTVLSVMIGVAAIVALISLVSGISQGIAKDLSAIGPTTLFMTPKGTSFTVADIAQIESLPNVSTVIPLERFVASGSIGGQNVTATIIGVNNYSLQNVTGGVKLLEGSVYNNTIAPVGVIGYDIAFPSSGQASPSVAISRPFYLTTSASKTIAIIPTGILDKYGTAFFIDPDSSIFVPLSAAQSLTGTDTYNILLVQASNSSSVGPLDTLLTNIYGNSASIISIQQIASTVASITNALGLLLGGIAAISLIVAGISILSIMMVSVNERIHEIGILKSIGFKNSDIMVLFLSEALIIGFLGGVMGVAVGGGGSYVLSAVFSGGSSAAPSAGASSGFGGGGAHAGFVGGRGGGNTAFSSSPASGPSSSSSGFSFSPDISPTIIVSAILLAIVVSVLASLYPAWKASSTDPIKALRTE